MNSPKITIVIVTWNKKNDVINLLNSLRDISYKNYSIVVVDNASEDDSIPAIKAHDLDVHLIENSENLGGTGGFNTGIRYALRELKEDYIWLLDNDAEVTIDTLSELVSVLENDDSIGIAGSCIMSPEDRNLIVEAGSFVDWRSGTWSPNLRYQKCSEVRVDNVITVDYVAACSALVRSSVAKKLDGMDDRYFLHWDDIDFCLSIGDLGYQRVAVLSSKAYHGVEKGFNPQVLYYDFRNGLLTISKHIYGYLKFRAYLSLCFNAFAIIVLELLMGRSNLAHLVFLAVSDFVSGNYGKSSLAVSVAESDKRRAASSETDVKNSLKKVIVFADGAYDEIIEAVGTLKELAPDTRLTFSVNSEKQGLFHGLKFDNVLLVNNFKDSILRKARNALSIVLGRFDCGISCVTKLNNPYVFLVKKHYVYDPSKNEFYLSEKSIGSIWKVFLALLGGIVGVVLTLPVVWIAGLREKRVSL